MTIQLSRRSSSRTRAETTPAIGRFTGRASSYSAGRPNYPPGVIKFLEQHTNFSRNVVVADIGSGTGKLSELFLVNGNEVFAVEPNADMRHEAERMYSKSRRFHSIDGTAECTHLGEKSIDLVTAGQSFHWFDPREAKREFARILKPPGTVLLLWNTRKREKGTFGHDYESLITRYGRDRKSWNSSRKQVGEIANFFGANRMAVETLDNSQKLDFGQLISRVRSSSYMPKEGLELAEVKRRAREIFEKYANHGTVVIRYVTELYLGVICGCE